MNSKVIVVLVALAFIALASSSPVELDDQGEVVRANRHRRVTCDLLSLEVKKFRLGDAACIAHCLAMFRGYTGGNCQNGVCHCKK